MITIAKQGGTINPQNNPKPTNPNYPNRLPNQSLSQRSKYGEKNLRPQLTKPPNPNHKNKVTIEREKLHHHYMQREEWKREVQESGLLLITKEKAELAYNKKNECFYFGQSSTYEDLNSRKTILTDLAKSLNLVEPLKTEFDHINPSCCRKLVGINKEEGRAIAVPKSLNRLKQWVNANTLARRIEDYADSSVEEGQLEISTTIDQNMWNAVYKTADSNKEFKYLIDNNLDLLILNAYEIHRPLAIAEMQTLIYKLQMADGPEAAKITFVIMRLITMLDNLPNIILKKANFYKKGKHLTPNHVINSTEEIFDKLVTAIISIEQSLKLSSGCRDSVHKYIHHRLICIRTMCINACASYIMAWEMEPHFPKNDLEKLKIKLTQTNFLKLAQKNYLTDLTEIYKSSWFERLEVRNLSSTIQFEEFCISDQISDHLYDNWESDPYECLHTFLELKKLNSIKKQKKIITSQLKKVKTLNLKKIIENLTRKLNSIDPQILSLNEIEDIKFNNNIVKNQFETISQKLKSINTTNTHFLSLISQSKNLEGKLIIGNSEYEEPFSNSIYEFGARYDAMQNAIKSYSSALNASKELKKQLEMECKKTYDNYRDACVDLYTDTQTAYRLAQQGIDENMVLLEKIELSVDDVNTICNEIINFLDSNLTEINRIETITDDDLLAQSENNTDIRILDNEAQFQASGQENNTQVGDNGVDDSSMLPS